MSRTVTLRLANEMASILKEKEIHVPVRPGMTVRALLEMLGRERANWFSEIAQDPRQTRFGAVMVILNQQAIQSAEGMEAEVKEGDCLYIIPPIQGGS